MSMLFVTQAGMIGRGDFGLAPGDHLAASHWTSGSDEVILVTKLGRSIRCAEEESGAMEGVRGISLADGDAVVSLAVVIPEGTLLVVTEHGYAARTSLADHRLQSPGGRGIPAIQINEGTGSVVGALTVRDGDAVMLMTARGKTVRLAVKDVRETTRYASCVRPFRLEDGDKLRAVVISREVA